MPFVKRPLPCVPLVVHSPRMQQPTSTPSTHSAPAPVSALAIVNAKVWTGDRRRPWADAILVRGERIEIVGSSAEVKKRAGGGVHTIDAKGMMIMPDFDAAHPDAYRNARGVLASGRPADLVLIDRDITRVAPETIRDAQVILTMVGGRVMYDRDGLMR
jgi:predicted amidohydrolase YtcJ